MRARRADIFERKKLEKLGKGKAMMKIYCDRCGEEIAGIPLKMLPTACKGLPVDVIDEMLQLKEPIRHKVFCKGCIAEIADFALDRNACDECVEQMMEENAMLRELDPDELDRDRAYTMAERLKKIRTDCGLNQIEFSKILGVTNAHISRMEKGITVPSDSLSKLICKAFGINEEWLRSGEGYWKRGEKSVAGVTGPVETDVVERGGGDLGEREIVRYLFLIDRRLDIISSGFNWKPEYEEELERIDSELAGLRELVDAENVKREQAAGGRQKRR